MLFYHKVDKPTDLASAFSKPKEAINEEWQSRNINLERDADSTLSVTFTRPDCSEKKLNSCFVEEVSLDRRTIFRGSKMCTALPQGKLDLPVKRQFALPFQA